MASWNEQRRSTQDNLNDTLRDELMFLRTFREHALGKLARLPKRSGASSSLLKPATEMNPLGSNEGSRTTNGSRSTLSETREGDSAGIHDQSQEPRVSAEPV
jgi:hypothetical protein